MQTTKHNVMPFVAPESRNPVSGAYPSPLSFLLSHMGVLGQKSFFSCLTVSLEMQGGYCRDHTAGFSVVGEYFTAFPLETQKIHFSQGLIICDVIL